MRRLSVDSLSARLWHPRCVLCDAGIEAEAELEPDPSAVSALKAAERALRSEQQDICRGCLEDLPWLCGACSACGLQLPAFEPMAHGEPDSAGLRLCGPCLAEPLFSRCRVAFEYAYPVNQLVQALKFGRRRSLGRVLGHLLGLAILQPYSGARPTSSAPTVQRAVEPLLFPPSINELPEIIIPVPLHRWRLFTRGYNQAAEIAACLPPPLRQRVALNLCRRTRATPMQTSLARRERAANLTGAFMLTAKGQQAVPGKHVAVLDDVMTTGATAHAMSRLLYAAGASKVEVWAVARTI